MSPKERVRLNIYKTLLEEEKVKSERKSYISVSVFVIGIFAGSMYNYIPNTNITDLEYKKAVAIESINKSFKSNMDSIDNFFNEKSIRKEKKEMKTDEYFVMNMQG